MSSTQRDDASQTKRVQPNQLGAETSPYLLQHAFNPVDWYPWGDEALSLARQFDKPIFLSIGYSACHWCHVMEHESFENTNIARLMNEHFVCIKVDREERPDLDQIYMTAVQMMTGRGGWPMSVFLTPDLRPFFGGTYWPPLASRGMPGFQDILNAVQDAWRSRRGDVLHSADELTNAVVQAASTLPERKGLSPEMLRGAMRQLLRAADRSQGGFGGAPKFPHPMDLRVLLRCWKRFGDQDALDVVRLTLDKMASGGIYDHLGGGFHRYSTDALWLTPHFEKMLYDNALLTQAYLEAYQATGHADYARVARETLDYVLREMTQTGPVAPALVAGASVAGVTTDAGGTHAATRAGATAYALAGFYSTQDADSEGEEGKFFVWSEDEVLAVLGPEDGRLFCYAYDVTPRGNWEEHNILNRPKPHEQAAKVLQVETQELEAVLNRCRQKLFDVRLRRVAPGRDDKVLVSWNGLMIAAMSQAAQVLEEPRYADAARAAADFILQSMQEADGRLRHSFKDGKARFTAYLDDYACLIDGLVDLYQATFDVKYLDAACKLAEQMVSRFEDPQGGGFFFTAIDHEQLIARQKDTQDNATPSGNGMAAFALARLGTLCGNAQWLGKAYATLEAMSGQLEKLALASGQSLIALDFVLGPTHEIVVCDALGATSAAAANRRFASSSAAGDRALAQLFRHFWPNKVVTIRPGDARDVALPPALQDLLAGKSSQGHELAVFVCQRGTCQSPIFGLPAWQEWLESRHV